MGVLAPAIDIFHRHIIPERWRQHQRWGRQHHPDGTGGRISHFDRAFYRGSCDEAATEGRCTWWHILLEKVYEAGAETERDPLRGELVQVAAVCVAWIEDLDNRAGDRSAVAPVVPVDEGVST